MREVEEYQQEIEGHSVKIEDMQQEITLLKTKHVYQEVFNINVDGPIGAISGFRMGSLAKEKVEILRNKQRSQPKKLVRLAHLTT